MFISTLIVFMLRYIRMSFESLSADRGLPEITLLYVVGDYGKLKTFNEQMLYD